MLGYIYESTIRLSGFFLLGLEKVCLSNIDYRAFHVTEVFYLLTDRLFQTEEFSQ